MFWYLAIVNKQNQEHQHQIQVQKLQTSNTNVQEHSPISVQDQNSLEIVEDGERQLLEFDSKMLSTSPTPQNSPTHPSLPDSPTLSEEILLPTALSSNKDYDESHQISIANSTVEEVLKDDDNEQNDVDIVDIVENFDKSVESNDEEPSLPPQSPNFESENVIEEVSPMKDNEDMQENLDQNKVEENVRSTDEVKKLSPEPQAPEIHENHLAPQKRQIEEQSSELNKENVSDMAKDEGLENNNNVSNIKEQNESQQSSLTDFDQSLLPQQGQISKLENNIQHSLQAPTINAHQTSQVNHVQQSNYQYRPNIQPSPLQIYYQQQQAQKQIQQQNFIQQQQQVQQYNNKFPYNVQYIQRSQSPQSQQIPSPLHNSNQQISPSRSVSPFQQTKKLFKKSNSGGIKPEIVKNSPYEDQSNQFNEMDTRQHRQSPHSLTYPSPSPSPSPSLSPQPPMTLPPRQNQQIFMRSPSPGLQQVQQSPQFINHSLYQQYYSPSPSPPPPGPPQKVQPTFGVQGWGIYQTQSQHHQQLLYQQQQQQIQQQQQQQQQNQNQEFQNQRYLHALTIKEARRDARSPQPQPQTPLQQYQQNPQSQVSIRFFRKN